MKPETRLEALSEFLKAHRSKVHPRMVGLPEGTRRRTPGLRREEVAQLAGVSTTWYTWLEQGRTIKASPSVLDAISSALLLNTDERKYLYDLALETGAQPSMQRSEPAELITPSLRRILQELRHCPTIISDNRCNIVGWNDAAAHVFINFNLIPAEQRNLIQLLFTKKELRSLAVNWEHFVKGYLAIFRVYYGQYVADEWYTEFIEQMESNHPEFHDLWMQSEVSSAPEVIVEFRHARAGKMLFDLSSLQVQGGNDLRCSVYTPVEDSNTETKLRKLMDESVGS